MERKKCAKREDEEDRFSQLPISLLSLILSFLSLKEAAATSILSKFWRRIWLFSDILDFDAFQVFKHHPGMLHPYQLPKHTPDHVKWVCNVLQSHHDADMENPLALKKLRIHMRINRYFQNLLDAWISYASRCRVQNLELDFLIGDQPIYPVIFPCWFTGSSMTDLTCLRSLSLANVDITGEVIQYLLLKCLFLESLKVCKSEVLRRVEICGPSLALRHLEISYCKLTPVVVVRDTSLVSLTTSWTYRLVLDNNPKLVVVCNIDGIFIPSYSLGQLQGCLPRLQSFTFCTCYRSHVEVIPELSEVKQLCLYVDPLLEESLIRFTTLLSQSPKLEKLVLEFVYCRWNWSPCWMKGKADKPPRFPRVKVIEVRGYDGTLAEDKTLEHILQHAVAPPEKIVFDPHNLRRDMYAPITRSRAKVETSERVERLKRVATHVLIPLYGLVLLVSALRLCFRNLSYEQPSIFSSFVLIFKFFNNRKTKAS